MPPELLSFADPLGHLTTPGCFCSKTLDSCPRHLSMPAAPGTWHVHPLGFADSSHLHPGATTAGGLEGAEGPG